jgi:hypothetical protein
MTETKHARQAPAPGAAQFERCSRDSYLQVDLDWMTKSVMVGWELEMQELHLCRPRLECPRRGSHCVFLGKSGGTYQKTYPKT